MPSETEIEITDQDIAEIEAHFRKYFDCSFTGDGVREALKCVIPRDIQAAPGSGKTTLLVAKLAILSAKFPWRDTGICVLSHTNVAKTEVENLLTAHPTGHNLLRYPHHVGTIQSFVDKFLALPYLRSKGIEVHAIDNDRFAKRAVTVIKKYYVANVWLNKQHHHDLLPNLRYEGANLILGSAAGRINLSSATRSYKELVDLKESISKGEGLFRFDDMYAFAEAYIQECPSIVKALRKRFPWIFIDEMQDTNALQEKVINFLFGDECILQRFGDVNQSIYSGDSSEESQKSFPKDDAIDLLESKRFGTAIAAFASNLTSSKKQSIKGSFAKQGKRIAILFDNDSIHNVLPEFGNFVLEENNGKVLPGFIAKAVGFRKTGKNPKPEKVPFNISDYWSGFNPDLAQKSSSPDSLIGHVAKARWLLAENGELKEPCALVVTGILRFLYIQGAKNSEGLKFNESRLNRHFERQQNIEGFKKLIATICLPLRELTKEYWSALSKEMLDVLGELCGGPLAEEAENYLAWDASIVQANFGGSMSSHQKINIFNYKGFEIEVGTIHSVKSQTHSATLVLETYLNKKHDLQQLLPYIEGESDASEASISNETKEHIKRIFVGGTRPREIVGIAMHSNHITPRDVSKLKSIGWEIRDITCGNKRT